MTPENNSIAQTPVTKALKSLQATHNYQRDRLHYGSDRVYRYVEDVDGNWLETWGDEKTNPDNSKD